MARTPKLRRPSFFKILAGECFRHRLRLPPEFARNLAGALPGEAKLKVADGPTWVVGMEKMEDESIWFCRGWAEFAEDMELQLFDFLVFAWFSGKSTFKVCCYGKNGCRKETTRRAVDSGGQQSGKQKKEASFISDEGSGPSFVIILKLHRLSTLHIPKHFVLAAGLAGKQSVCLEYEGGNMVNVQLDCRGPHQTAVELTEGWPEFRRSNGLGLEKAYLFRLVPGKMLIRVRPIEGYH